MKGVIRKAKSSESTLLSQLAFDSKAYWGYSQEFMNACKDELIITQEKLCTKAFSVMVYELEGDFLGFYSLERLNATQLELEALFIQPQCIGKGIGKKLIKHAIDAAKREGVASIKIQGDPNAEKFYLASGAKKVGKLESLSIKGRYLPLFSIDFKNDK